ncbi:MAG: hypothetical protein EBZ78_09480, partial [Verrucomicrobia bacterium]|nr:hypothetical protein [Verrucomicrobiota bacterium]
MVLDGAITALTGGDVVPPRIQPVILQPFSGSEQDIRSGTTLRAVTIGSKSSVPQSSAAGRLELLASELRTIRGDTVQVQTLSEQLGGPFAINVIDTVGLVGDEANGGINTFRLKAPGDINLVAQINSIANATTGVSGPLGVSLAAGNAAVNGQLFAKAGISSLNGAIDLAGTDILIAEAVNAGTGIVSIRPTRYFGVQAIAAINTGAGYDPEQPPLVNFSAPQDPGGIQARGLAQINAAGQMTGIRITEPGTGYVGGPPTVTIVDVNGTGAGAAFSVQLAASDVGRAPGISLGGQPALGQGIGFSVAESQLITAQTLQIGSYADDYTGILNKAHPFVTSANPVSTQTPLGYFLAGGVVDSIAPTYNTGRITLADNFELTKVQDLVLVSSYGVLNAAAVSNAFSVVAGGLGVISGSGSNTYPTATVQLYGQNNVDRLALIVPNGSVAYTDVDGFIGGGNFGVTTGNPGAVGGWTYSATRSAAGIAVVNTGKLSITSGGAVTVRERAFTEGITPLQGASRWVLSNKAETLAADLSQAGQGDAFFFESVGVTTVGDLRDGVVTSIQTTQGNSISYGGFQPTVTISPPDLAGGAQATATAIYDPLTDRITGFDLGVSGAGYSTRPTVNVVVPAVPVTTVDGLGGVTLGAVTLSFAGAGYTSVPTVTLVGGNNDATATAALNGTGGITITVTGAGTGYTDPPLVLLSGGGTDIATVSLATGGTLGSISLGRGYTSAPTLTVVPGAPGSGATAVATGGNSAINFTS